MFMSSSASWPILIYFIGKREVKKKMNSVFIPSHSIGEVYIDVFDLRWHMLRSSFYNFRKNIPFFKLFLDMGSLFRKNIPFFQLLLDMGSLMMRCYIRLVTR